MKISLLALIAAYAEAIKVESDQGYNIYWEFAPKPPPMWDVVSRGERKVKDFADEQLEAAMKRNPSSGTWPIAKIPEPEEPKKEVKPHYWKQPWEFVVKKGNSDFNDVQVDKALKRIPEPIVLDGKALKGSNPPDDHSW